MPLTIPRYRLALDDLANEVEVEVLPGDQLRAEVEGNRRGLTDPKAQTFLLTTLWLWAASRRVGVCEKDERFDRFVDRLVAWDRVKPEGDEATVDPTREAGPSTSASSSQPGSPDSTGSDSSTMTPPSSLPPLDSSTPIPTTTGDPYS